MKTFFDTPTQHFPPAQVHLGRHARIDIWTIVSSSAHNTIAKNSSASSDGLDTFIRGEFELFERSSMDYYDIETILAEDEHIQCEFKTNAIDCGYLDPSCATADIEEGQSVELPIWLAMELGNNGLIKMELPRYFSAASRKHLRAGPASVPLREKAVHFYKIGQMIHPYVEDGRGVLDVLRLAVGGERYCRILDQSMNSHGQDTSSFTRQLTQSEQKLFALGSAGARAIFQWKAQQVGRVECSDVLPKRRTRRRLK